MFKNYLSGWIANLGVEPLVLFAAFLLLPILVFLAFLLFLVTLVFETILYLLNHFKKSFSFLITITKQSYLPINRTFVKTILMAFIISIGKPVAKSPKMTDIVIGRGEVFKLKIPPPGKYIIGNKEVISSKYRKRESTLLLKGKMLGYSQVQVFTKGRPEESFNVYIISKRQQLEIVKLKNSLSNKNLLAQQKNNLILEGVITNLNDYLKITSFLKKKKFKHNLLVEDKLRKKILAEIYYYFLKNNYDETKCEMDLLYINCFYKNIDKPLFQLLKKKYSINFIRNSSSISLSHYRLKMKVIQLENSDSREFKLGLDKLQGSLSSIFNSSESLYENNSILLNNKQISYSTLARPEITIREDKEVNIEIGSDIPFQVGNNQSGFQQQWKFTGLKFKIKLKKIGEHFIIDYNTEFSRPAVNNVISGSKQQSSISLKEGIPTKVFNIGYMSTGDEISQLPYLSKIPLLGKLFTSTGGVETYKKVIAIITIEK